MDKKSFLGWFVVALIFFVLALLLIHYDLGQPKEDQSFSVSFFLLIVSGLALLAAGKYIEVGAARTSLPNNGEFEKCSEYRRGGYVFLILHGTGKMPMGEKLYKLPTSVLLNDKEEILEKIPNSFKVLISWRVLQGEHDKKRPKTEKVYLLR